MEHSRKKRVILFIKKMISRSILSQIWWLNKKQIWKINKKVYLASLSGKKYLKEDHYILVEPLKFI